MKLCLACFRKCEDSVQSCPHCGYGSDSFVHSAKALPIGTVLCGETMTGKAEITDENTITYFALDKQTQSSFKLEEYYPEDLVAGRKGNALLFKNSECAEKAKNRIASLENENEGFAENNTYYRVVKNPEPANPPKENKKTFKSKANKIFRKIAYVSAIICLVLSVSYLVNYYITEPLKHRKSTSELQNMLNNTVATVPGIDPLEQIRKDYPGVNFPDGMNPNYAELYAINNEFAGQLTINGLDADYAVMQTDNNDKYLSVDFYGNASKYGQPYFDYRNDLRTLNRNTIIHGHNMRSDNEMFGMLEEYRKPETFKKAPTIKLNTLYGSYTFKIYAVIIVNSNSEQDNGKRFYYNFTNATDIEFADYLKELDKRKLYSTGVDINSQDKILTLSTCCYDFYDARLAVIGRLVRDGESAEVDTSLVTTASSPKYPQAYYDAKNKTNPYKNDEHLFTVT